MKIRIKGNSVRLRLSRSEVERLGTENFLEERTEFAGGAFIYALQQAEDIEGLSAAFVDNKVTMYVPAQIAKAWATNEIVGYSGESSGVSLLLEKDFKCTDATVTEDQSDNYEHPSKVC